MKEILQAQKEFQTSKVLLKIPQIYFYHITTFLYSDYVRLPRYFFTFFSPIDGLWLALARTLTYNLTKFFIFNYPIEI